MRPGTLSSGDLVRAIGGGESGMFRLMPRRVSILSASRSESPYVTRSTLCHRDPSKYAAHPRIMNCIRLHFRRRRSSAGGWCVVRRDDAVSNRRAQDSEQPSASWIWLQLLPQPPSDGTVACSGFSADERTCGGMRSAAGFGVWTSVRFPWSSSVFLRIAQCSTTTRADRT